MNFKHFLLSLLCVTVVFACSKDDDTANPCDNVNCPEGFTATVVNDDCECIDNGGGSSDNIVITGSIATTTWTKDNVYELSGKAVVEDGATLTIEPGTVIKARAGINSLSSALIIARGGKIMAEGTATEPIIFTAVTDNIQSGQISSPNLDETNNALWGGLIVLGYAPVSAADGDTEAQIEGIPADDLFGRYGGDDPTDNSGVIRYVSVRHGGALLGDDNEINGITFGGVGNGTVVENIEVVANLDDGVEFFGGTVNVTNVVVAYGEDDGLDIDQNYSGTITNAFVLTSGATAGDNAVEIDGPEGSTYTDGLFTIKNLTMIDDDGAADTGGDLKASAQGTIDNASWRGFTDNVKIRSSFQNNCADDKTDAYTNYATAGTLKIINSEWVGNMTTIGDWTTVYTASEDDDMNECTVPAAYDGNIDSVLSSGGNAINAAATGGADATPFAGWSWVSVNSKL